MAVKMLCGLIFLYLISSCAYNKTPNTKDIKGVWGLSGMKLNETLAKTKMNADELAAQRYMLSENFNNILKRNYSIIVINDSISFYHRILGVDNSNYKDNNSYVYGYSTKYDLTKNEDKYYIALYTRYDTTNLEIFSFSVDRLEIEAENSQGLGMEEFIRIGSNEIE